MAGSPKGKAWASGPAVDILGTSGLLSDRPGRAAGDGLRSIGTELNEAAPFGVLAPEKLQLQTGRPGTVGVLERCGPVELLLGAVPPLTQAAAPGCFDFSAPDLLNTVLLPLETFADSMPFFGCGVGALFFVFCGWSLFAGPLACGVCRSGLNTYGLRSWKYLCKRK